MKNIIRNISAALFATMLLLIGSCTKENIYEVDGPLNGVDRNNVVDITLPYNISNGMDEIIVTKAGNEEKMDSQLNSVLVLVYEALDENNPNLNKFVYSRFFSAPGSSKEGWVTTNPEKTQGTMTLPCPTGHVFIYLVANWTNTFIDYATGVTAEDLNTHEMPQTQAELFRRFIPKWKGNIHTVDGLVPMIATVHNNSGLCEVTPDGNIRYKDDKGTTYTIAKDGKNTTKENNFNFERLMAKITMNFNVAPNNDPVKPNKNATFTPTKYAFRNVATHVAPTSTAWAIDDPNLDGVQDTPFQNFSTQSTNSFTIYIPENIENCTKEISGYAERERMEKDENGRNVTYSDGPLQGKFKFANAPEYSTYVEVIGKYKDPDNDIIDADTRFFIHLGHFSKNIKDFNVLRDHHYTFNVKVKGVNDIIVESMDNQEDKGEYPDNTYYEINPGVDGLVFRGGLRAYCDAHYDQVELRLSKNEIQDSTIIFAFTPYGTKSGIYYPKGSRIKGDDNNRRTNGVFVPLSEGTTFENIKQYLSWIEIKQQDGPGNLAAYRDGTKGTKRKNIFTILDEVCSKKDGAKNFYYTSFVNEFYYTETPEGNQAHVKDFVNKADRSFALGKAMYISKDNQSVTVDAIYLIYQKSIATFYELDKISTPGNEKRKYGIETINETGRIKNYVSNITGFPGGSDYWDGRSNTLTETEQGKVNCVNWAKNGWLIEEVNGEQRLVDQGINRLNAGNQYAVYACMTRNRDVDGDGQITENELRWYNPAINQLLGIWIGEAGLPANAALFTEDFRTTTLQFSSKYTPAGVYSSTSKKIIWAEEGCSIGKIEDASQSGGDTRTVRNLADDITSTDDWKLENAGQLKFYTYDESNRTVEVFLSPVTMRSFSPGELAPHTERSATNKVYKKIQLANGPYKEIPIIEAKTAPTTAAGSYTGNGETVSGNVGNWRLPNQRELALLYLVSPEWCKNMRGNEKIHCRTAMTINTQLYKAPWEIGFSRNAYTPFGYGYNWSHKMITCINIGGGGKENLGDKDFSDPKNNPSGWVYCVRDVQ